MEEKKSFSIFHIPVWSFFSKELYKDAAQRWKGTGFGYLLLLVAIVAIFFTSVAITGLNKAMETEFEPAIEQIPEITINDSGASADVEQPYYINNPKTGEPVVIIDTTGQINNLEDTGAYILLTKKNFQVLDNSGEVRKIMLSGETQQKEMVITQDAVSKFAKLLKRIAPFIIFPFVVFALYIVKILVALFYALIGLLLGLIFKSKLNYTTLLRLSVVAMTPPVLLNAVGVMFGIQLPFANFIYFVMAMVYLSMGIIASRPTQETAPAEQAV